MNYFYWLYDTNREWFQKMFWYLFFNSFLFLFIICGLSFYYKINNIYSSFLHLSWFYYLIFYILQCLIVILIILIGILIRDSYKNYKKALQNVKKL